MEGMGRLPPSSVDAERAILGAALLDRDALLYVVESLTTEDFYEPRNAAAFEIIADMAAKDKAVDNITFINELSSRDMLEKIGGTSFLTMIVDSVTTTANLEHHCQIVKDKSLHRDLIKVGSDIVKIGFSEEIESPEAVSSAEQMVYNISKRGSHKETFKDFYRIITDVFNKFENNLSADTVSVGVKSGFKDLDHLTGGFQPGSLNIIAARPSMGKTAFALNIARYASVEESTNVLFFSLEMSAEQLGFRLLEAQAQVDMREIERSKTYRNDQWNAIVNAASVLSKAPIKIDDSAGLNTMELRSKCRRFFSKHRGEPSIIMVDYLQLVENARRTESRQQDVSDISRALKGLAREFEVPVIALSQLSREVEKRGNDKRPILSDLRDSGAIEQDADIVAFLFRPTYYDQDKDVDDPSAVLSIAKHRNGPTGKIDLIFYNDIQRFESRSNYNVQ